MPLHLLGKKSWNVYNADNIARVKRDEAAAAAREAEIDARLQEEDAAARLAILRGEKPPPLLPAPETSKQVDDEPNRKRELDEEKEKWDREARKRKRKKTGEDDTDRDIRVAQQEREELEEARERLGVRQKGKKVEVDAPIVDHNGHISLFPEQVIDESDRKGDPKRSRKDQKEQQEDDGAGMRFSDAAGRGNSKKEPWYASSQQASKRSSTPDREKGTETGPLMVWGEPAKNVWGNEDPRRKARDEARTASTDPLAFMRQAQTQLKKVDAERKQWVEEREREVGRWDDERERRREKRDGREEERRERYRHHRRHKHRSRSRSRSRHRRRDDGERHLKRSDREESKSSRHEGRRHRHERTR